MPGWRAAFSGGEVEGGVLAGDGDDQEAGIDNQTALEGCSSCDTVRTVIIVNL